MSKSENIRPIKPSEASKVLRRCFRKKRSAFLWGPPGIGKSAIIFQIADEDSPRDEAGEMIEDKRVAVYDVRLLLMEPTDLRGMPRVAPGEDVMRWTAPSVLPPMYLEVRERDGETFTIDNIKTRADLAAAYGKVVERIPNERKSILFLDELTAAPTSLQAAAYQLVHDRRIGDYVLPDGCAVVAAGNRQSDRGVAYKMPTPLRNRFTHFEMQHDYQDWAVWAIGARVNPFVIAYLEEKRSDLFRFDPTSEDVAFPTPRSWEFVSNYMDDADEDPLEDHLLTQMVAGAIGIGVTSEFMAHREFARDLPKVRDILSGKAKKMNTKNTSAQFFLSAALCYAMSDAYKEASQKGKQADFNEMTENYFTFIMANFKRELVVMSVRAALKNHKIQFQTSKLKAWNTFYDQYGSLVAEAIHMN